MTSKCISLKTITNIIRYAKKIMKLHKLIKITRRTKARMASVLDELTGIIIYNSNYLYNTMYTSLPRHKQKSQTGVHNSEVYSLFGECNELSRCYYNERNNRWNGAYPLETIEMSARDYYYEQLSHYYLKFATIYSYRVDIYTRVCYYKVDTKNAIRNRLQLNNNNRSMAKYHTYFINSLTHTCNCYGFCFTKKCKHLVLIKRRKSQYYTYMVLILSQYMPLNIAIDISREYFIN